MEPDRHQLMGPGGQGVLEMAGQPREGAQWVLDGAQNARAAAKAHHLPGEGVEAVGGVDPCKVRAAQVGPSIRLMLGAERRRAPIVDVTRPRRGAAGRAKVHEGNTGTLQHVPEELLAVRLK